MCIKGKPRQAAAFVAFVWLASAASAGLAFQDVEQAPLYVIQPDDVLEIFVYGEKDLSRSVVVRPDGRISVPLVQDLVAAGITPGELKLKIQERLADYIKEPNVTVIVNEIRHYQVFVTGNVQNPGAFRPRQPINVLQAISLAGGFTDFANRNDVTVVQTVRLPEGQVDYVVRRFHYEDVVKGKKLKENIILRSGDVVVVP